MAKTPKKLSKKKSPTTKMREKCRGSSIATESLQQRLGRGRGTAQHIPPASPEQAVTKVTALVTAKAASVTALRVFDEPSLARANELLEEFKGAKDVLEEKRKFFLGPMKESLKRLEQQFKGPAQMLFDADRELRNKVLAYVEARRATVEVDRARLVAKAEAAAEAGDDAGALGAATEAVALAAPAKTMLTESSRVSVREVDAFEVVDYGAVPHEFFTLDEKKVLAAIRSGQTSIPGIRAFKKAQLAVGGI